MVSMICHCIGNEKTHIKGRQMPVHYSYREGRFICLESGRDSVQSGSWSGTSIQLQGS